MNRLVSDLDTSLYQVFDEQPPSALERRTTTTTTVLELEVELTVAGDPTNQEQHIDLNGGWRPN